MRAAVSDFLAALPEADKSWTRNWDFDALLQMTAEDPPSPKKALLLKAVRAHRVVDLSVLLAQEMPVWWPGAGVGNYVYPYRVFVTGGGLTKVDAGHGSSASTDQPPPPRPPQRHRRHRARGWPRLQGQLALD